ncbi:MAG TPA: ABC transporter permease [Gemmatimonadaceae bacterium]|nr:ABC transporter permease [Gemmatimonadaceae bacterium]
MNLATRIRSSPLWPMLWKEFIQMRRDRLTLAMMVVLPAIQLILFGFAIRTEVRHLPTVVLDESRTSESRALLDVMRNSGNFDLIATVNSRDDISRMIERGAAAAAVVIPPDYMRELRRGRTAQAQVIVDAADPLSSQSALSGAALAGAARTEALLTGRLAVPVPLDVRVRPWYNPDLRSEVYIVPGLIGILLSITMILITSMAIVRERERGTLEQLIVTPIDKTSLMLGKILPFVIVGYVQMSVVLFLGRILFDVPIRGSIGLLYLIAGAFIIANLAVGLVTSTLAQTQVQAMQMGFFFIMPNFLLSGFMFPRAAMPVAAQWIGAVLPLTYFLDVLRGILLKGAGLSALWPQMLALFAFAAALIAVSVRRFQKTLE